MRKNVTKVAAALLSAAMVVTSVSVPGTTSEAATIKISASKKTIYSGGPAAKKKVSLTVKKGSTNLTKKCKWTSSKKAVATVGAKTGKVTAKKAGKTVIKAVYGKKTYKCTVTVKAYKYATKIAVSPTSKTLTVGGKQTLKVTYTGAPTTKGVTFKSSSAAVASVTAKGVVTAKKAGTATITVSTKANVAKKTLKKTVKITVKAASSATAAPASAAPASTAPAESAAPASTAPAPASAAPAATATAPTTAQPTKDPEIAKKVDQIVITSKEALTNPADAGENNAGKYAYVYYQVLNAYGDDITAENDIQWTTSPAKSKADKATGRIKIEATDEKGFTYGQQVFVTGVHVSSGKSVSQAVPIGLTQTADSIETKTAGFVDKNEPTKLLKELPKNFSKETYYFVCQTKDQNGHLLDVTESDEYGANGLTFVSNDPTKLTFNAKDTKNFTIKDDKGNTLDYAGIAVEPALYSDKGGEVSITAIGKHTGKNTPVIVRIGEAAQIASIDISLPKETVTDGDQDVEIPFVAKDTNGNTVTSYETMVRTGNGLMLTASEGTLKLSEKDDGTAKLTWSDDRRYLRTLEKAYTEPSTYDGLARPIILMVNVLGGQNDQENMSVSDMRIPTTIKDTNMDSYVANGGEVEVDPFSYKDKDANKLNFTFVDQYGKDIPGDEASAFFTVAGKGAFRDKSRYGVKVIIPSNAKMTAQKDNAVLYLGEGGNKKMILTAKDAVTSDNKTYAASEETYKFCVAKYDESNKDNVLTNGKDWGNGKQYSQTITAVPMNNVTDLGITVDQNGVNRTEVKIKNEASDTEEYLGKDFTNYSNGETTGSNANHLIDPKEVKLQQHDKHTYSISGKYKGNAVKVPVQWMIEGNNSRFKVDNETLKKDTYNMYLPATLQELNDNSARLKSSQFFDYSKYGNPAKDAAVELSVAVANEDAGAEIAYDLAEAQAKAGTGSVKDAQKAFDDAKAALKTRVDSLNSFQDNAVKTAVTNLESALNDVEKFKSTTEMEKARTAWRLTVRGKVNTLDYTDPAAIKELIGNSANDVSASTATDNTADKVGIIGTLYVVADAGVNNISSYVEALRDAIVGAKNSSTFIKAVYDLRSAYADIETYATVVKDSDANSQYDVLESNDISAISAEWKSFKEKYEALMDGVSDGNFSNLVNNDLVDAVKKAEKALKDKVTASSFGTGKAYPATNVTDKLSAVTLDGYAVALNLYDKAVAMEKEDFSWSVKTADKDANSKIVSYQEVADAYVAVSSGKTWANLGTAVQEAMEKLAEAKKSSSNLSDVTEKITNVRKDVVLNASPAVASTIDFPKEAKIQPTDTKFTTLITEDGSDTSIKAAVVKDQYGYKTGDEVVYTVSDYVETKEGTKLYEFTHKKGDVLFENNGAANPKISGAEIGDTFKVTAKVKGLTLSKVAAVTVRSDSLAYVSNDYNSDKDFRMGNKVNGVELTGLGYIR